jgi:hypothetical protein
MKTLCPCPVFMSLPQLDDLMHAHKIAQLISRGKTKPADLSPGPRTRISKGFDFMDRLTETDLAGLKFDIQSGPQIAP